MPTLAILSPSDLCAAAFAVVTVCAVLVDFSRRWGPVEVACDPDDEPLGWTEEDGALLDRIIGKHTGGRTP